MKAQVMVVDVLFFTMLAIMVIFLLANNVFEVAFSNREAEKQLSVLEQMLFVEKLVSDCNFFSVTEKNRNSLCYKNKFEFKFTEEIEKELREKNVCKIEIDNSTIYNTSQEIKNTYNRGVILNNEFKVAKISFC